MEPISSSHIMLNVAEVWPATYALGPGLRSVVWVQGCPRSCPGCVSPEWIPQVPAWHVSPESLVPLLLRNPDVDGITFSGGEPMLQAAGLAALAKALRKKREINIICYTGFTYQQLMHSSHDSPIHSLLEELDVLIDGPYVASLDDNLGLRGSSNQKVYYLSDRLCGYDFETQQRTMEIHIENDYIMMVGVPSGNVMKTIEEKIVTKGFRKIL